MGPPATAPAPRRIYSLALLLVVYAFSLSDRFALGLLLQDIKSDLKLTDTELGFLTGIAFALFYSIMGVPIARRADRGDRTRLISLAIGLWSATVALSAAAASFAQLLLARIGVAVGEAGCLPPSLSLISDFYDRASRPRAISVFMLGACLSTVLGYFVAGVAAEHLGWRGAFLSLAAPGCGLALLAFLTLRDPRGAAHAPASRSEAFDIRATLTVLWRNRTFRQLVAAYSIINLFGQGIGQWLPSFFVRSHGMKLAELGTWLAVIYGAAGLVGTYMGGELASRLAPSDEARQLRWIAGVCAGFGLFSSSVYLAPSAPGALLCLGLTTLVINTMTGPVFAAIQTVVPPGARALAVATLYLFSNLVGGGLGPLGAGVLSDALQPLFGSESLRYALIALCPGYLWAGWHLWRSSRSVARDLVLASEQA